MQGPILDLVMLSLLILFFGVHQRSRPELFYRFWLGGWICVFLSYAVWEVPMATHALERLQDVVRFHLTLLGLMLFTLAPLATPPRMRRAILALVSVYLLESAALFVVFYGHKQHPVIMAVIILLGEVAALWSGATLIPEKWVAPRATFFLLVGVLGVTLVWLAGFMPSAVPGVVEAETVWAAAIMYAVISPRRNLSTWIGLIGFMAWGAFYVLAGVLDSVPNWQRVVYSLWSIPKYLAGFSMILRIFEESRADAHKQAVEYRKLYEDFRLMFEGHPHPMWIYEPVTRRLLTANRTALRVYGYGAAEVAAMTIDDLELPVESNEAGGAFTGAHEGERQHRYRDGKMVWVAVTDTEVPFQGQVARMMMARDVTRQRLETDALFYRANHDVLTGLPNRALLGDRVEQCLLRSVRDNRKAALITIDVDHFKQINDTHGHMVGDACLKAVAARLLSRIRQVDTLARTGGEEFTAIIGGLHDGSDAEKVGRLLLEVFTTPIQLAGCDLGVTVSVGVAVFPDDGMDMEALQRKSDTALYAAKHAGRNCLRMAQRTAEAEVEPFASAAG